MSETKTKIEDVILALLDNEHPFPSKYWRRFSDLSRSDLQSLVKIWPEVNRERKIALFEDLETVAESDTLVNFEEFSKIGLADPEPAVKVLAMRALWESEDHHLVPLLTELMMSDPAEDVRAAAAYALGRFVYLGELETIPDAIRISNVQNLLDVVGSEELAMVRRRALESLGYSGHPKVPEVIRTALGSEDTQWVTSALYAIGRSADEQWADYVLEQLNSPDGEIEFEAIRAAGELEIDEARDPLLDKLEDSEDDSEKRYAILWALSQIGGEGVKDKFEELLEKSDDEEEIEWLEKGLDNLELGNDLDTMGLMGFGNPKVAAEDADSDDYQDDDDINDDDDEDSDDYFDSEELDEEEYEE